MCVNLYSGRRYENRSNKFCYLDLTLCNTVFLSIAELLAITLFTFQVHACENDRLQIRCPHGTTIDVKWAHYGRKVPSNQMCPPLPVVGRYKMANEEEEATTEADEEEEDTNCVAPKSRKVRTPFQVCIS